MYYEYINCLELLVLLSRVIHMHIDSHNKSAALVKPTYSGVIVVQLVRAMLQTFGKFFICVTSSGVSEY